MYLLLQSLDKKSAELKELREVSTSHHFFALNFTFVSTFQDNLRQLEEQGEKYVILFHLGPRSWKFMVCLGHRVQCKMYKCTSHKFHTMIARAF